MSPLNHGCINVSDDKPSRLKVFKAWVRGFFQGKMFIRNIYGYKDVIETKFGTWTDFSVLKFLSDNGILYGHVTGPENFTYLKNCQRI